MSVSTSYIPGSLPKKNLSSGGPSPYLLRSKAKLPCLKWRSGPPHGQVSFDFLLLIRTIPKKRIHFCRLPENQHLSEGPAGLQHFAPASVRFHSCNWKGKKWFVPLICKILLCKPVINHDRQKTFSANKTVLVLFVDICFQF